MEPPNCTALLPQLTNPCVVPFSIRRVQILAGLRSILSHNKRLGAEIDDMAETPKASSYAMFPAHVRIKSPQDQVDACIIRTCIVCHEITNPATYPVVVKYLQEDICHILT
jgi:hypothetical protein